MSETSLAEKTDAQEASPDVHPAAIVVIGASAGSFQALRTVVASLSPSLPAAIFVVLHTCPMQVSHPAGILGRSGALPAHLRRRTGRQSRDHIYVALLDHYLTIHEGRVRIAKDGREHFTRPAVDPLFTDHFQAGVSSDADTCSVTGVIAALASAASADLS